MSRVGPLALLACFGVLVVPASFTAPAVADMGVSIRETDVEEFPTVRLVVSTREAVPLNIRDVEVVENGAPVDVTDVSPLAQTIGAVDAVLAVDVSNSMRGKPLATALAAARTFLEGVPASMPVGIIVFSRQPVVISPVSSDRAAVAAAVASIGTSTSQGTVLFDAVATAASMFDADSAAQHNLILVTDGRNTGGTNDLKSAVEAAQGAGVNVFTIGLAGPSTDETTLRSLADRTGGAYAAISRTELSAVYEGLAHQLQQQYVVEYRSKAPFGSQVGISITLRGGTASASFLAPTLPGGSPANRTSTQSLVTDPLAMAIVAALTFLAILGLLVLVGDVRNQRRRERQLRSRLAAEPDSGPPIPGEGPSHAAWVPPQLAAAAERAVGASRGGRLVARRLVNAGWSLRPGEFLSIVTLGAIVVGAVGALVAGVVGAGAGAALATLVPVMLLSGAASRRLAAIQAQLADTLMVIASSMRAGHSFLQSLDSAAKEIDEPASGEFTRVLTEIRLGRDMDGALESLVERVGSQDLEWAVTAIKIQRRIGGNLAEVLETVARTIRERETIRRQVKVLSAEGRLSVIVLTVLPILLAGYLAIVNPDYLRTLTDTFAGIVISSIAGALMLIGYLWMRRIVRLDV